MQNKSARSAFATSVALILGFQASAWSQTSEDTSGQDAAAPSVIRGARIGKNAFNAPMMDKLPVISGAARAEADAAVSKSGAGSKDPLLKSSVATNTLQGHVETAAGQSQLLTGSIQALPKGTKIDFTALVNINSEMAQKGDEIWMQVSHDVAGSSGVAVPGGWFVHGYVTDAQSQKRLGRDGFVDIQFDKMVGPDKVTEVPFDAKISTRDKFVQAAARQVAIGSFRMGLGAAGGAILSVQMTGIPTAIATHGISVGVGAGIGASVGLVGALKRKGRIRSLVPGDEMKLVTAEPILLPGFNETLLASARETPVLKDLSIIVHKHEFNKDPFGDSTSKLLRVALTMQNKTSDSYRFSDLAVVSDHNQRYYPSFASDLPKLTKTKVEPNQSATGEIAFNVDGNKHKYWLVLLNRTNREELSRVPIN